MLRLKLLWASLLPKGGFARNVSVLTGGTAVGQVGAILAAPILARLYTPEDFGHFQVYLSVMVFGVVMAAWRYELAIILPEKDEVAANMLALAVGIVGVTSLIFAGVAWWAQGSSLWPNQAEALRPYLWLMPLSICATGLYQVLSYWALRQKAYSQMAATKLTQAASQLSTQLIMGGFFQSGFFGLLLGDALGRMSGNLGLARMAWRYNLKLFRTVNWRDMWFAAVRYRDFPLISSGSALLNTAGFALPMLMLGSLYSPQVLGWFALVERIMGAPTTLIGQAVSQVYMGEAARLVSSDPEALRIQFLKALKRLLWLGGVPCAVIFLAGPTLFAFIFGESWREAGEYARLLAVMHYVGFVAWPLIPTLNILEHQIWQLGWDIGRLALTLGGLWVGYHLEWPARGAIVAYGVAMLTGYAVHLFLSYRAIQRRIVRVPIAGEAV